MKKAWTCDGCHRKGYVGRDPRWIATIELTAAPDPIIAHPADLSKDLEAEIKKLVKQISKIPEQELKDEVHKKFQFTLCRACQKRLLRSPLPIHHRHVRETSRN
ncbi:MAG: hypothetical protein AAB215_04750 [Planctomycetota bacterium]